MAKSLRVQVEVDVHAVTCPGVWFSRKGPIYLSVCFLGFHVKTKPFPPTFPLLFGDKFVFEKTFPGCSTLANLNRTLDHQPLYIELLQDEPEPHGHHHPTVLATFETSGLEFLFPYPQLRPTYNSGVDVDLLMEPTRDFPGIISPKVEASTRAHISETRHAQLDQLHDNVVTVNQVPPMENHPHLGPKKRSRSKSLEGRDPFVWRHVEDELLGRKPCGEPTAEEREHHHSGCNHRGLPPQSSRGKGMQRSKSAVWGSGFRADRGRSSDSSSAFERPHRGRSRERRKCPPPPPNSSFRPTPRSGSPQEPTTPPFHVHRDYHNYHDAPAPPSPPPLAAHPPAPPVHHQHCQAPPPAPAGPPALYNPYRYHCEDPAVVHPEPSCQALPSRSVAPAHHPPICPDPVSCAYSCHVAPEAPPVGGPHLHSKPSCYHSSALYHAHHKAPPTVHPQQPAAVHHRVYGAASMPCCGPCCLGT